MDDYIAIILIPVYILLALIGKRLLTFAHGYEKGLEDAKKIKKIEEKRVHDKIKAEIGKSKTKHELQIAERDIKAKLLISDIYCDMVNILDKYKTESEETADDKEAD